eukprot:TRINITY_DN24465_c0_g1_i1.p1 TRINITY_DN24465_c0_g1~~TRINITY_DN24465_c0_g1_i1.p1  ORF type:complete len:331 (-),score=51.74 TRINITY_DN24465_c0_g1_i1:296-1288(-)
MARLIPSINNRCRWAQVLPLLVLSALGPPGFCVGLVPRRALQVETRIPRNSELRPVILCPAQFGTEEDYEDLKADLKSRGFALYPAPLSRFDWLRIVPSTLTKEFFTAQLRPNKTLGFFYEALDKTLARVEADFAPDVPISILGHSIGGWVARSYIGEVLGKDARLRRICSLVTLGTPHSTPPEDSWLSAVDQTRGLLSFINREFPSDFPLRSSAVTCIAGKGTRAPSSIQSLFEGLDEKVWDESLSRSKLLEQLVALASYLPLSGEALGVEGDGLIPVGTAVMPGCASLVLEDCNHADFVPTPGRSLKLPATYKWYGSPEFIDRWAKFL